METATMDAAFRATQADYDEGYKDGEREGYKAGYNVGLMDAERTSDEALEAAFDKGYAEGQSDAERDALTEPDYWHDHIAEGLDLLVRYFDAINDLHTSDAIRAVLSDYSHPSRVWDTPKEMRK